MSAEDFGKYRIERRIAAGGMAELFEGFLQGAKGFERKVAIKRILPHLAEDAAFQTMFWDEATLAANLSHPNVVQVLDFGEESGQLFMALEFVDGVDLKTLSRRLARKGRQLGAAELALIAEGISSGLHHVHTARSQSGEALHIIHRDISPHNVMVTRDGHVKVMDFGVAHAEIRSSKTATGVLKGKLAYMAPEQANDEPLDHRVDQFALGLLMWELAVGEAAYQGPNDAVLLRKVLTRDLEDVRTYRQDLPEALSSMVMKMLALNPSDRYPNMENVHRAALQVRFGLGEVGAPATLTDVMPSQHLEVSVQSQGPSKTQAVPSSFETTALSEQENETQAVAESQAPGETAEIEPTAATRSLGALDPAVAPTRSYEQSSPRRSLGGRLLVAILFGGILTLGLWLGGDRSERGPQNVELRPLVSPSTDGETKAERAAELSGDIPPEGQTLERSPEKLQPAKVILKPALKESPKRSAESDAAKKPTKPPRTGQAKPHAKGTSGEKGLLQLRAEEGWFNVLLGSRRLGTTPLGGVRLPVGAHRLTLENPVTGETRDVRVVIQRDKVTKILVGAE